MFGLDGQRVMLFAEEITGELCALWDVRVGNHLDRVAFNVHHLGSVWMARVLKKARGEEEIQRLVFYFLRLSCIARCDVCAVRVKY